MTSLSPPNWEGLGFKFGPAPYMFHVRNAHGYWTNHNLSRGREIVLDPMCAALSYGAAWFEGIKARRTEDGRILIFRLEDSARRAERSAIRLGMPPVPLDDFHMGVRSAVVGNLEFVPPREYGELYLRPQCFGTEPILGLGTGEQFLFTVSANPVGQYFPGGIKGKRFLVCTEHCRAAPGGTGDIKSSGNYGGANLIARRAKQRGFHEVLWLDPTFHYPQEIGAANLFWVKNNTLYTPPLDGMILPGINRDSVIRLAREQLGIPVEDQERYPLSALLDADEAFGTGTAAGIAPVGAIQYMAREVIYGDGETAGPITQTLHKLLTDIQFGVTDDPYGWNTQVELPHP